MTYLTLQQMQSFVKPTDCVGETNGRTSRKPRGLRIIHTLDPTRLEQAWSLPTSMTSLACRGQLTAPVHMTTPPPKSCARQFSTPARPLTPPYLFLLGHTAFYTTDPRRHRRRSASQGCLWELLVRDGYIFETGAGNYRDRKRTKRGTIFHRFGQPFLYNFSHHMVGWTVASESQGGKRVRVHARNPLRPVKIDGSPVVYTGTALCCLEKVGKGTERVVTIRILKIVDPVKQVLADVPLMRSWLPDRPVEGEFLPSSRPGRKWLYNVDKRCGGVAQSLALLFENERLRADNLDSAP
ncbi:uncharacterized protein STEHIDRAFT_137333 [Stereum hirsutum FP-91666 SS1]|uniref:uncharacterized protein n=1 Tax=Stereum hirsutum (strain FP-91666) TaxID=721885 RepID=UPI000440F934|nr:uncharacterized protein STEHIDRAFT_137333 [Stereum hirsutum FP-91666 SS1]EIM89589.1 hypothetical protein STEHIDRAFT_137333 [Stereum hirsutum FP-91666 SS1]